MMNSGLSFSCWFSNGRLVWLIIGFIFTSIIFVEYYFEIPCSNGNHPLSSYCLIFPSSMSTVTTKLGKKDREFGNIVNGFSSSSFPEGKIVNYSTNSSREQSPSAPAPPPNVQDSSPGINMMTEKNFTQISPAEVAVAVAECNNNGINIGADKKGGDSVVVSIATMNNILVQNYASPVPNSAVIH